MDHRCQYAECLYIEEFDEEQRCYIEEFDEEQCCGEIAHFTIPVRIDWNSSGQKVVYEDELGVGIWVCAKHYDVWMKVEPTCES